jgi:hypothetical protein
MRLTVQDERLANCIGASIEQSLPKVEAEHGDWLVLAIRLDIGRCEDSPNYRIYTQKLERIGRKTTTCQL